MANAEVPFQHNLTQYPAHNFVFGKEGVPHTQAKSRVTPMFTEGSVLMLYKHVTHGFILHAYNNEPEPRKRTQFLHAFCRNYEQPYWKWCISHQDARHFDISHGFASCVLVGVCFLNCASRRVEDQQKWIPTSGGQGPQLLLCFTSDLPTDQHTDPAGYRDHRAV